MIAQMKLGKEKGFDKVLTFRNIREIVWPAI